MKRFIIFIIIIAMSSYSHCSLKRPDHYTMIEKNFYIIMQNRIADICINNIGPDEIEAWVLSHTVINDGTLYSYLNSLVNVALLDLAQLMRNAQIL